MGRVRYNETLNRLHRLLAEGLLLYDEENRLLPRESERRSSD